MASSVVRMPAPADEWRDPNRIAGTAFGSHIRPKKVLLREPPRNQPHSSPDIARKSADTSATSDLQPDTPSSAMRRGQSQILDLWAARQARDMVTTIKLQAHRAELSELAVTTQPVSARAATFLRESSPVAAAAGSPSSFGSNSISSTNGDLPPQNVRASSLIQMWRELEAEAGVACTPRTLSGATTASSSLTNASDDSEEASGDSEPDNEKGRVGSIVRMISCKGSKRKGSVINCGSKETNELASIREQPVVSAADRQEGFGLPCGGLVRLRSRRDIEDMVERMRKERQRDIEAVGERHVVSRFSHRGRIQSVLKLRFLRRESAVQDHPRPSSKKRGSDRSQSGSSILLLREIFDNATQHSGNEAPQLVESSRNGSSRFPFTPRGCMHSSSQFNVSDDRYQEAVSSGDQESSQTEMNSARSRTEDRIELDSLNTRAEDVPEVSSPDSRNEGMCELNSSLCRSEDTAELNSPDSVSEDTPELNSLISRGHEDLQEVQNPDASWDERSLWVSNLDWQRSVESSPSQGWQGEVENEEIEPYSTRQHVADTGHIWIGSCSPSWRGWGIEGQDYHGFLDNFSDNTEIRELLERRMVSTSLASDFCGKMNQMILTFLNRQDQLHDENYSDEYEEKPIWRSQNRELNNADQVASGSSLVPSSYQSVQCPESWQYTSFTHNLSLESREPENTNDLRTEMAQMREEISQLRKLVESCMEWQTKLQHSIKDEVAHAVSQPVTVANTPDCSKWTPNRKETCCICYEQKIDSLLYRCGHMCTCFKCAQELQWSSGRCPICRSSIADVVRTYPNS